MTAEQLKKLRQSQKDFFDTGRTKEYKFRLNMINELERQVKAHESEIYEALRKDISRSSDGSFLVELGPFITSLKEIRSKLKSALRPKRKYTPVMMHPARSFIQPEPYGSTLIFSSWNYPINLSLSPVLGAIACGNTVILKPSEYSAHSAEVLKKIINKALPKEFVEVCLGGVDVANVLLEERWDYIFFTGSTMVGKIIAAKAAKYLTPVTLELGGKSPTIVTKNANLKVAARRIIFGKYTNAGQTCIAPDHIYVEDSVYDKFVEAYKSELVKQYGVDAQKSPDYTRIISKRHYERLASFIDQDKVLVGGKTDEKDLYIEPTLMEVTTWKTPVMEEEIFGPIFPIMKFSSLDDVLKSFETKEKPLAAYIYSESKSEQQAFLSKISAGGVCINDSLMHFANHSLPFGGVGESGIGKYHGSYSFETFTNKKSCSEKYNII